MIILALGDLRLSELRLGIDSVLGIRDRVLANRVLRQIDAMLWLLDGIRTRIDAWVTACPKLTSRHSYEFEMDGRADENHIGTSHF